MTACHGGFVQTPRRGRGSKELMGRTDDVGSRGRFPDAGTRTIYITMDIKKINEHMEKSEWTAMLGELPPGTHTLSFPNVDAIKSCKAIAYSLNSDKKGRRYTFNVDKDALSVRVKVEEQ